MSDHSCPTEALLLLLYGELAESEVQSLRRHLEGCPECRRQLEELRRDLALLPRPALTVTAAETQQFAARVCRQAQRRGLRPRLPAWGGALMAAGAVALSVLIIRPDPGHPPSSALHFGSGVEGGGPDSELLREFELLQELELLLAMEGLG